MKGSVSHRVCNTVVTFGVQVLDANNNLTTPANAHLIVDYKSATTARRTR
jgi:hypothetical protein